MPETQIQYRHMYNFCGDYIHANSNASPRNHDVCNKMAIHLVTSKCRTLALLLFALFLADCIPMYYNIFKNQRQMIIPVIVPFVHPDTELGYIVNSANEMLFLIFGPLVIFGTEMITCVLKNAVTTASTVVGNSLEELGDSLEKCKTFDLGRSRYFTNIIVKITDYDRCERKSDLVVRVQFH